MGWPPPSWGTYTQDKENRMAMKEMERVADAAVPDLVRTPALEIDAEDVALPKLKLGQYGADAVKGQLVKAGSLFTQNSNDDPDPVVLLAPEGKAKDTQGLDGVVFHVLGVRKGKSYSEPGGDLETYAFNDPNAPEEAWTTFTYSIAIPSENTEVPYTFFLTKTGKPAAKAMNTQLVTSGKPPWHTAFAVTTKFRENPKGQWFVPVITTVEATDENIAISERLAVMIAGQTAEYQATGEVPEI